METKFESDIKNIFDLKQRNRDKSIIPQTHEPSTEKFSEEFENLIQSKIEPILHLVNSISISRGYSLEMIMNPESTSPFYTSLQIFLKEKGKEIKVEKDPYVLLEGYPQKGKVRITDNASEDGGIVQSINFFDPSLVESYLLEMIKKN